MGKKRWINLLVGLFMVGLGVIVPFYSGQILILEFSHPSPLLTVCQRDIMLLGILPLSRQIIPNVEAAEIETRISETRGSVSYRLILNTERGDVPVTGYKSVNKYNWLESSVVKINAYINSFNNTPLILIDNSGLVIALFFFLFLLVGLYILVMWGGILGKK